MRRLKLILIILIVCCFPILAYANQQADLKQVNYMDYLGNSTKLFHAVAIEGSAEGEQLKFFQWQSSRLTEEQVLYSSSSTLLSPQVTGESREQLVVTYLEKTGQAFQLYMLTNFGGQWRRAYDGKPLNQNPEENVKQFAAVTDQQWVFVGYLQGNALHFIKYDLRSGVLYPMYSEDVSGKQITSLKLVVQNGNLVYAYTFLGNAGTNLQIERIRSSNYLDLHLQSANILGYDLAVCGDELYVTYDHTTKEGAELELLKAYGSTYTSVGTLSKRDSAPEGLKLLNTGKALAILYRDQGINQQFDLYLVNLAGNQLAGPLLVNATMDIRQLANVRENLRTIDAQYLFANSPVLNRVGVPGVPELIDLTNCVTMNQPNMDSSRKFVGQVKLQKTTDQRNWYSMDLNNPGGITSDDAGFTYLIDRATAEVNVFNPDGALLKKWQVVGEASADLTDIMSGPKGNLYITDAANDRVVCYTRDGQLVATFGQSGSNPGMFKSPVSLASDGQGNIYVLDQGNNRVQKFDPTFKFVDQWNCTASTGGMWANPGGLALDGRNRVYVADTGNHRVQVFDTKGKLLGTIGGYGIVAGKLIAPTDVAVYGDKVYVTDRGNNRVQVFDTNLTYLYQLGERGSDWGYFRKLNNIYLDPKGNIYLTDEINHSLQVISPDFWVIRGWNGRDSVTAYDSPELLGVSGHTYYYWDVVHQRLECYDWTLHFGQEINMAGQEQRIFNAIAVDQDQLYLTDILNNNVVIYDHQGNLLKVVGGPGEEAGRFMSPEGICVDATGAFYVADTANHRIQKFTSKGDLLQTWGSFGTVEGSLINPQSIVYNGSAILVTDLGLKRVQSFAKTGEYQQRWQGLGDEDGQLSYKDYLHHDLQATGFQIMTFSYPLGLTDDTQAAKSKLWSWLVQPGYQFRFIVNKNLPDYPTGPYSDVSSTYLDGVSGKYFLHIQVAQMNPISPTLVMDESTVYHYRGVLDNTPPTVTMPANSTTPVKSATLSWTAKDNLLLYTTVALRHTISQTPFSAWDSAKLAGWNSLPFPGQNTPPTPVSNTKTESETIASGNGTYYLVVQAIDIAGNMTDIYQSSLVLDNTSPTVTGYQRDLFEGQVRITCSGSDNLTQGANMKYRCVLDTNPDTVMTGSYQMSGTFLFPNQTGLAYLHIQAMDEAGNESAVSTSSIYLGDVTAPVLDNLSNIALPVKSHTWSWSAHDNVDQTVDLSYRFSVTTAPVTTLSGSFVKTTSYELKGVADGTYYLNIQAMDLSGNQSEVQNYSVIIDNKPPLISTGSIIFTGTAAGGYYRSAVTVEIPQGACTDENGNVQVAYSLDGVHFTNYTAPFTVSTEGSQVVTIRATDQAQNVATSTLRFQIDLTAPVLVQPAAGSLGGWFKSAPDIVISATDALSGLKSISYNLNSAGWLTIANGSTVRVTREGANTLDIKLEDNAGNSQTTQVSVKNDFTPPVMSKPTSTVFSEVNWTYLKQGQFQLTATDGLSGGVSYNYLINSVADSIPNVAGNYLVSTNSLLSVSGLQDGISYLHVQPVDAAGNIGQTVHFKLLIADEIPAIPVILSDSHPVNGTGFANKAHFYWYTPDAGTLNIVGITEYEYIFRKVENGSETIIDSKQADLNEITFSNLTVLPAARGYYEFALRAVNAAGKQSDYACFRFNVDAPSSTTTLAVLSDTHPSDVKYYNSNQLHFTWNNPLPTETMTYYYQFSSSDKVDDTQWIGATEAGLTLTTDYSPQTAYFYVKGVTDQAVLYGNTRKINLDFARPKITAFNITVRPFDKQVAVYWGNATDTGGSGIAEIKARITAPGDERGWSTVSSTASELTFNNLQDDRTYRLELAITDAAGNKLLRGADVNLLTGANVNIGEQGTINVAGWTVDLTTYQTEVLASQVTVPEQYAFTPQVAGATETPTAVRTLPFSVADLRGNEFYATNTDMEYTVNLSGFVFHGKGFYINPTGFYLSKIWLAAPETLWRNALGQEISANKELVFENVRLATDGNRANGRFVNLKTDCVYDDPTATWALTVSEVLLNQAGLSLAGQVNLADAYGPENASFTNLTLNTSLAPVSGQLGQFNLSLPDSTLKVTRAQLYLDHILVEEALFSYTDDTGVHSVKLGNFTVDLVGTIAKQANYYSEAFSCTYGQMVFNFAANKITFTGSSLFVTGGKAVAAGTQETFNLTDIALKGENPSLNQGVVIASLEKYVSGFKVQCFKGYLENGNIVFQSSFINLPVMNDQHQLVNLQVANVRYTPGGSLDISNMQIIGPQFGYKRLGTVNITGIIPEASGFKALGTVKLANNMPLGLRNMSFEIKDMQINAQSGITNLELNIPANRPLTLYNTYQFTSSSIKFRLNDNNLQSIYINDGQVGYIGAMAQVLRAEQAAVTIVEIENTGKVVKFDSALRDLTYNLLGLTVQLNTKRVEDKTITFNGEVELPIVLPGELSGLKLQIFDLIIDHDTGQILKFNAHLSPGRAIQIAGWSFELYGITFVNNQIKFVGAIQIPQTGTIATAIPQLAGQYIDIDQFVLDTSGNIVGFNVNIPLDCEFQLNGITVKAADLGISMQGGKMDSLALGFAQTNVCLPAQLGGGIVSVDNLSVNCQGQITYDQIRLAQEKISFMNVAEVSIENAILNSSGLSIQGKVTLGESFPVGLKGKIFTIKELLITSDNVTKFNVGVDFSTPVQILDAFQFTAQEFSISNSGLTILGGNLAFINQLGQLTNYQSVTLNRFEMDYSGKITAFDVSTPGLNFNLFGCTMGIASIGCQSDKLYFTGNVTLPSSLPGQLSGLTLDIETLAIGYDGSIAQYAVTLRNPATFDLNGLQVTVSSVRVDSTGYSLAASFMIPDGSAIPQSLRGLTVSMPNLKFDNNCQLVDFSLNIDRSVQFALDKLNFEVTSLGFTKSDLSMSGNVVLPDTYPGTLKSRKISFTGIKMNYQGEFIAGSITTAPVSFTLGSYFTGTLNGLTINLNKTVYTVRATTVVVKVMSPVNTEITFDNLSLDSKGNFTGKVRARFTVDVPMAGSTLRLKDPGFGANGITVAAAELIMPASLGGQKAAVTNVTINPTTGMQIGGGEFRVKFPNLTVGKVGIQNAYMGLKIESGQYIFEGNGTAQVPGIGQLVASIKLRNQSTTYPAGIERIYLSFTSAGLGLAIGTTGLYINGVYGEFADGPIPATSPSVVKKIGDGMRFNLGVYIRDLSGSLKGDAGFWVNITNSNAAVTGKLTLLNELVSTDVYAAVTKYFSDFYAEANISILKGTIIGNAGFHIWSQNKASYLAGWSKISVVVKQGQIVDYAWIKVPTRDTTIPNLGAEFGDFKGGVRGVKGFIGDLPVVGQIGFFAGNIGFKIGGVSQYVLMDRATASFRTIRVNPEEQLTLANTILTTEGNFILNDKEYISFTLQGQSGLPRNAKFALTATAKELQNYYVQSTERAVFAVGYEEGDPDVVAIAPDGTTYTKDSVGVEYLKEAHQIQMSVPNPVPGLWHIELDNVRGLNYQVAVLGTTPKPEIFITNPANVNDLSVGNYTISGRGGTFTGEPCFVDLYYDTDGENFDGRLIAERIPVTDYTFSYAWDTNQLPSGEYFIYGKLYDDGSLPPSLGYASGSVSVVNQTPLLPPNEVTAVPMDLGIQINWQKDTNPNIAGYKVYYGTTSGVYDNAMDVGLLDGVRIKPDEGSECYLTVVAYDVNAAESTAAPEIYVPATGTVSTQFNLQTVEVPAAVHVYIGEGEEFSIPYTSVGEAAGNEGDYFQVNFNGLPEGTYVNLDRPVYNLYALDKQIKVRLITEESQVTVPNDEQTVLLYSATPSLGNVEVVFNSVGNPALALQRSLNLHLEYRNPELNTVEPTEGINDQAREIILTGSNFRNGAQVFLNDQPLEVLTVEKNQLTARVPQGFPAGWYTVKVQNDDGKFVTYDNGYHVLRPYFTFETPQQRLTLERGGSVGLDLTAQGFNGFTGEITVTAGSLPAGFWVLPVNQILNIGQWIALQINAGYEVTPGLYQLTFSGLAGNELETLTIPVEVVDGNLAPVIEGVNKPFALTTEPITVYGNGFGLTGNLYLNGQALAVTNWSTNRIEATIPVGAASGVLIVESGGVSSEPYELLVKEKKYSVSLTPGKVRLNRADTVRVNFAVTGFSEPINFTLENVPEGVSYNFLTSPNGIVPNYDLGCEFTASANLAPGQYQINLVGSVGAVQQTFNFTLEVVDLPTIATGELAEGRVGVPYEDVIDISGGIQPYDFELMDNSLPPGLVMDDTGKISGNPGAAGVYPLQIRVGNAISGFAERTIQLKVLSNEWIYSNYDTGRRSITAEVGPAANGTGFITNMAGEADLLLSSEDALIVGRGRTVELYNKNDGTLRKQLTLPENVNDVLVLKDKLVVLTVAGDLVNYTFGAEAPVVAGFTGQISSGELYLYRDKVLVLTPMALQIYSKDSLTLEQTLPMAKPRNVAVKGVLVGGAIYYVDNENAIQAINLTQRAETAVTAFTDTITRLQLDGNGANLLVMTVGGAIEQLSLADGFTREILVNGAPIKDFISLPDQYLSQYLIADAAGLKVYGAKGDLQSTLTGNFDRLIVAGGRVYTVGQNGIGAYKLSTLAQIWNYNLTNAKLPIVVNHTLYAVSGSNLYQFQSPTNIAAPETQLLPKPMAPDGESGYFLNDVVVYLESTDSDNEVALQYYAVDGGSFEVYDKGIVIGEGEHRLDYYAVDEAGLLEDVKTAYFRVDTSAPTVRVVPDQLSENGYIAPVTLTLEAFDSLSGVQQVYYQLDGGLPEVYTEPLILQDGSNHQLTYWAVDNAGNTSAQMVFELTMQ